MAGVGPYLVILLSFGFAGQDPATAPADPKPEPAVLIHFTIPDVEPKSDDADSPLPEGFPRATRPGVIEVKTYPGYRSAVARGKKMSVNSGDMLFWSLFQHIERNEIAMTAPVIQTYSDSVIGQPRELGEVSMEFLYRTPTMGKLGADGRAVAVEDHESATYVCLGIQGGMSDKQMRAGVEAAQEWLKAHESEWVAAGPARRLGYHGPMTQVKRRLWEVQIPVRPAGGDDKPATGDASR
jgi:hypothetical protein